MAEALLRATGGQTVLLRMPQPAMAGAVGEQLGLATPGFQDTELGPVVFRRVTERELATEMLVSACAVAGIVGAGLVGAQDFDAAKTLFATALGIVVGGDVFEVLWVRSAEAFGVVYLYRVGLRGALRLTV